MELSLCHVLAVQQPPLLSHTHHTQITHARTHTVYRVSTTQQFSPQLESVPERVQRHNCVGQAKHCHLGGDAKIE